MHVGLNCIFLVPGETGGLETYARALIPALRDAAPGVRFTAFVPREARGLDLGVDTVVVPLRSTNRVEWVRGEQLVLPAAAARAGCDVVHSLASTGPATGRYVRVTTVHDLHYLLMPEAHFGVRALGMRVLVPLAVRRSQRVICVAEIVRRHLGEHLGVPPGKVDVVQNGLGRPPAGPVTAAVELRARLDLGARPVALTLSAMRPHKNLGRLLEALARIPAERRPVAVLPGYPTPHAEELGARAAALGVAGDVRFPGWLPEPDVEGLFALAGAFVFPSLHEGFGLPVLEAMVRGVPVACSDASALPEVAGNAALLFDPLDPGSIAAAIERLLGDPAEAARLREAGRARAATFTWERAATGTLASYERARSAA